MATQNIIPTDESELLTFNVVKNDIFVLIGSKSSITDSTEFTMVPNDGSVFIYPNEEDPIDYNIGEGYVDAPYEGLEEEDMIFDGDPIRKSGIGTSLEYSTGSNDNYEGGDPSSWKKNGTVVNGSKVPSELASDARYNVKIKIHDTIVKEYIPIIKTIKNYSVGAKLLAICMTQQEGFYPGSTSYKTNNPGNIGNTDNGSIKTLKTLTDGIKLQLDYISKVSNGKHTSYPLGKKINMPPFYSMEIYRNPKYKLTPYLPGYIFVYGGLIEQYVKIYSTAARVSNSYVTMIVSWFRQNGYDFVTEETTITELVAINSNKSKSVLS